ncbi:MAG: iron-sulfur cluster repair di-iron protein [Salibacteraceae bacterium]
MNLESSNLTIAQIVAENYKTADVFKKHGIDFCCGGQRLISDVCKDQKLNFDSVITELELVLTTHKTEHNFNSWSISFLIDYIENNHHSYLNENLPIILQYAEKVATVHGDSHPETIEIFKLFKSIVNELTTHLKKEELMLFPNAKRLEKAIKEDLEFKLPPFEKFENPISAMENDHDLAGDLCKKISELSNNYQPPKDACNTYIVLYAKLKEFEDDLHKHVHLENNILHPKLIKLEAMLEQANT